MLTIVELLKVGNISADGASGKIKLFNVLGNVVPIWLVAICIDSWPLATAAPVVAIVAAGRANEMNPLPLAIFCNTVALDDMVAIIQDTV